MTTEYHQDNYLITLRSSKRKFILRPLPVSTGVAPSEFSSIRTRPRHFQLLPPLRRFELHDPTAAGTRLPMALRVQSGSSSNHRHWPKMLSCAHPAPRVLDEPDHPLANPLLKSDHPFFSPCAITANASHRTPNRAHYPDLRKQKGGSSGVAA